jgi:hypothetical protein
MKTPPYKAYKDIDGQCFVWREGDATIFPFTNEETSLLGADHINSNSPGSERYESGPLEWVSPPYTTITNPRDN